MYNDFKQNVFSNRKFIILACSHRLGVGSQFVTDQHVSSSSSKQNAGASFIELNNQLGAWSPAINNDRQWIQVVYLHTQFYVEKHCAIE